MIKCSEMLISPGIPIFVDYLDIFQQIFVSIYICDNNVPTSRVINSCIVNLLKFVDANFRALKKNYIHIIYFRGYIICRYPASRYIIVTYVYWDKYLLKYVQVIHENWYSRRNKHFTAFNWIPEGEINKWKFIETGNTGYTRQKKKKKEKKS
jgi:hypothetical protein